MDWCLDSRTPNGPRRGLYSGIVLAGIGVGMVVGQGVAVASPAEATGATQSGDTSDASDTSDTATSAPDRYASGGPAEDDAPRTGPSVDDEADTAEPDETSEQDEADAEAAAIAADSDDGTTAAREQSRTTHVEAEQETTEPDEDSFADEVDEPADEPADETADETAEEADESADAVGFDAGEETVATTRHAAAAPAATPEPTLRSLVSIRPVTVESIVADVLTWAGLRRADDDAPDPVTPVSGLVEALWLAVRQTQYTWNNQRPIADVTISGPGPDGAVAGALNAVDFDDTALTYIVSAGPAYGRVLVDAAGHFTYTPGAAAMGRADQFTIRIDDTSGNPFHVHGLLGLLGLARPVEVTVTIAATPTAGLRIPSAADVDELASRGGVQITTTGSGAVRVIEGRVTDQLVVNTADAAAVLNDLATVLGAPAGFADLGDITVTSAGVEGKAEHFYRFTEKISGITVLGSEVILVTDVDGDVTSVFNYYRGLGEGFNTTPAASIDEDAEVRLVASSAYLGSGADPASLEFFLATSVFANELIVYPPAEDAPPALAWRVVVHVPDTGELAPSGATFVIDADGEDAGDIIITLSNAQAAAVVTTAKDWLGDSRSITVETRRVLWFSSSELHDSTRNITTYKTSYGFFGLGGPVLPGRVVKRGLFGWDTSAVSAHANAAVVYDYFEDVLGRVSYDDNGAQIVVSIRYRPSSSPLGYTNAFWDPTIEQFAFGDKGYLQADIDIVAHEYTHAVVTGILGASALNTGQSGALNEAFADIFGVLIEGSTGADRWLMGDDTDHGIVRNLADPESVITSYGPYRSRLSDQYTGAGDDHGEHINSTIFSHAAYLMMTDAATAAVSDETWAKVFYHALPRLSTTATFVDGRAAVLSSAFEQGLTLAQREAITRAFDTVEIYGAPASSVAA